MPRFYFFLRNGVELPDDEGANFDDVESARQEAVRSAREMMAEDVKHRGQLGLTDEIEVFDEGGASVIKMAFEEAVQIKRK